MTSLSLVNEALHEPAKFDFGPEQELRLSANERRYIELAVAAITPISRTFQGISDTSISTDKRKLEKTGPDLSESTQSNFRQALEYLIPRLRQPLEGPLQVQELFEHTAALTNNKLLSADVPYLRTWPGHPGQSAVEDITADLGAFHAEYIDRHDELLQALHRGDRQEIENCAITFAAWIEKRYNHEIHPQYDGCGKNSKCHAVAILALAELCYPFFPDRGQYISWRGQPLPQWTQSFREHMREAA